MFEIGFWELALLFALGLVVLGPEKLPKVAAQLGRYAGQARRMARTLTAQVRDEIEAEERRLAREDQQRAQQPAGEPPVYSRPGAEDLIPRGPGPSAAEAASADTSPTPRDA